VYSDIRAVVHKELVTDPGIDADDIVFMVFNGDVSLTGTVPSQNRDGPLLVFQDEDTEVFRLRPAFTR
jgi:BON domain